MSRAPHLARLEAAKSAGRASVLIGLSPLYGRRVPCHQLPGDSDFLTVRDSVEIQVPSRLCDPGNASCSAIVDFGCSSTEVQFACLLLYVSVRISINI